MKAKPVSYTSGHPAAPYGAQEAHLEALAARPENEVDYSDVPALTEEQFRHARRGVFYRPVKRHITARVDADVLDWVEAEGKGYQTLINAIFRRKCSTPQSRTGK